ncbi:MAG: transporter substrate-binding domain-containing protein [Alphaproteobacteria bacterium]|nr:transporter substrate-binding domain-containing protein [Alphaproteobacteria bacterium]
MLLVIFALTLLNNKTSSAFELTIGRGNENYFPFEMTERGKLEGIHIASIEHVAKRLEWNISFKSLPWNAAVLELKTGKLDALSYLNRSPEREAFAYFLDENALSVVEYVLFTKHGSQLGLKFSGKIEELTSFEILQIRGYYYGEEFENAANLKKADAISLAQQAFLIARGRYNLGIANKIDLLFSIRSTDIEKEIDILSPPLAVKPTFIGFSKVRKLEQAARQFSVEFKKFKGTKEYSAIWAKYDLEPPVFPN